GLQRRIDEQVKDTELDGAKQQHRQQDAGWRQPYGAQRHERQEEERREAIAEEAEGGGRVMPAHDRADADKGEAEQRDREEQGEMRQKQPQPRYRRRLPAGLSVKRCAHAISGAETRALPPRRPLPALLAATRSIVAPC